MANENNNSQSPEGGVGMDRRSLFKRYGQKPSFSKTELSIRYSLAACGYLTMAVTIAIVLILFVNAVHFFWFDRPSIWGFATGTVWNGLDENFPEYGVLPLLWGTLMVAIGSSLVAIPIGLGIAIYLTQYASRRMQEIVTPIVEILGGVPTVVYGYFAVVSLTPFLQHSFLANFFEIQNYNVLAAAIVVGICITPMVSSMSVDALKAVPGSIRNAAYAVGMRKFHVVTRIMIPAAFSGIVASFILAFSRAIGETMAVSMAAGLRPQITMNIFGPIQTMTSYIVQVFRGEVAHGSEQYYSLYAVGLTLFLLTFAFNFLAGVVVRRFREEYQ